MTYYIPIIEGQDSKGEMFCEDRLPETLPDAMYVVMDWHDLGYEVAGLLEWEPGQPAKELDVEALIAAEEADRGDEKKHGPQGTILGEPWR